MSELMRVADTLSQDFTKLVASVQRSEAAAVQLQVATIKQAVDDRNEEIIGATLAIAHAEERFAKTMGEVFSYLDAMSQDKLNGTEGL